MFRVSGFSRETGRPRQLHTGPTQHDYVPLDKR